MNRLLIIALVILVFPIFIPKGILAEDVVVYSNKAWQMTDIILKKNHTIRGIEK